MTHSPHAREERAVDGYTRSEFEVWNMEFEGYTHYKVLCFDTQLTHTHVRGGLQMGMHSVIP